MNRILVTGATGFLGWHVVKRLNERGIRPRVLELRGSNLDLLGRLNVERCDGDLGDARATAAACEGVDTLLHTAFKVSVGSGAALLEEMRRINVTGTGQLLDTAAGAGVRRAVVSGSALAVGVNRRPQPLDESADWSEHHFDFPYAVVRREAEQAALSRSRATFVVSSVAPSFTLGPEDPVGAPANKLLKGVIKGNIRVSVPVGFGCLDVRDFAAGMVAAGERGTSGQRYLLSGENVTARQFLEQAAAVAGVKPPWFQLPPFVLHVAVAAVVGVSALRRKPAPVSRSVLQLLGRYAWYDTARARTELGWSPRPLRTTLEDTVSWLRRQRS
jgi:dihydroflavonol-4-reductase